MYLSKKKQNAIAVIITKLSVCSEKAATLPNGDAVRDFWLLMEARLTIELFELYGIELPTLPASRQYLGAHERARSEERAA